MVSETVVAEQPGLPAGGDGTIVQEPSTAAAEIVSEAPVQEAPAQRTPREIVEEHLGRMSLEEIAQLRAVNDRAQSIAAQQRKKDEEARAAKEQHYHLAQQQVAEAQQFTQYVDGLDPTRKWEVMQNPANYRRYQEARDKIVFASLEEPAMRVIAQQAGERFAELARQAESVLSHLSDEERDGILAKHGIDLGAAYHELVETAGKRYVERTMAEERKTYKDELTALRVEIRQLAHRVAGEPEAPAGGTAPGGSAPTQAEYAAMTPVRRAEAQASGEVDRWSQQWAQAQR